jgi:methyl-accepting chemotaxis protein
MSFKVRLISFISIAIALVMAVFFAITNFSLDIAQQRFGEEAIRGKSVLWQKVIQVELDQMEASTSSLTRSRDALKALNKIEMTALSDATLPTYNRLSASNVITRLQIANTSGQVVFSAPENFSGSSSKNLIGKALAEKKIFKGVERDDDGLIVAEISFPLYFRGKLVGVGIYMVDLAKAMEKFKQADGSDFHLFSDNKNLEYSSNPDQFNLISEYVDFSSQSRQFKYDNHGLLMSVVQFPLSDESGNHIANLASTTDYTESYLRQSRVYTTGIIAGLLAFAIGILLIYYFIQHSFKPMNRILTVIENIAVGNLTDEVIVKSNDEFGRVMKGLQDMQSKLKGMIDDINLASQQIDSSAEHLESVTNESSKRVNTQSQITGQLVNDIDQLINASNNVTQAATEANSETSSAVNEVSNGRNIITDGVKTIQNISDQVHRAEEVVVSVQNETQNIGSVLDVIKGIAEQTNLLALNAAIEAARAGEQGRGFSVVADEVRTLASRTSQSTQEIEAMIESLQTGSADAVEKMQGSIKMVEKGVEIVNLADQSFDTIAQSMTSISAKNESISSASENQMSISRTMHDNVQTISSATNSTLEGNQITVTSTEELIALAEKLKQKVKQFTTS